MIKKILKNGVHKKTFLLSLLLYNSIILTNFTEYLKQSTYQSLKNYAKKSEESKKQSLYQKAGAHYNSQQPAVDQVYDLLKKRTLLRSKLLEIYKPYHDKKNAVPDKESFSIGYVIGSSLFASFVASPALSINYLNKYITPEKYQKPVDTISLGAAKLIAAVTGLLITKQATKSFYDFAMYEPTRKRIKLLEDQIREIDQVIRDIKERYSILSTAKDKDDYKKLRNIFFQFYEKNNRIINKDKVDFFISTYFNTLFSENPHHYENIEYIITVFKKRKDNLIAEVVDPYINQSGGGSSWSSGNLAMDIVGGLFMLPWLPIVALFGGSQGSSGRKHTPYPEYESLNKKEYEMYAQIDRIDTIIKKLEKVLSETKKDEQSTNLKNPAIQHHQSAN